MKVTSRLKSQRSKKRSRARKVIMMLQIQMKVSLSQSMMFRVRMMITMLTSTCIWRVLRISTQRITVFTSVMTLSPKILVMVLLLSFIGENTMLLPNRGWRWMKKLLCTLLLLSSIMETKIARRRWMLFCSHRRRKQRRGRRLAAKDRFYIIFWNTSIVLKHYSILASYVVSSILLKELSNSM